MRTYKNTALMWGVVVCAMCFGSFRASAASSADFTYQSLNDLGPGYSSRVLLCNNDFNDTCRIEGQGYYDTNETATVVGGTFWWHSNEPKPTGTPDLYLQLLSGTSHILYQKTDSSEGKRPLWTLIDCRTGAGGYHASSIDSSGRNYLPWSGTCQPINPTDYPDVPIPDSVNNMYYPSLNRGDLSGIKQVAHISMRCSENAVVYSPFYEDGIGEIYFDVVNGWDLTDPDAIEVQVATEVLNDDNESTEGESTENVTEGDEENVENDSQNGIQGMEDGLDWEKYKWTTVPCDMFVVEDLNKITLPEANRDLKKLQLDVTRYGKQMYYRVRINLNHRGAIRFRIRRLTSNANTTTLDYNGLIFIDNIIVSYPGVSATVFPMGVLSQSADYSENGGRANLGYVGAFTEPILSRGLEGAKPRMSFSAVTNGQPPWVEAKAEVAKATCAYRWKYLNQAYGPWKSNTVENLTVYEGTNVIWDTAIEVPDKVGDIEYSYSAWVSGTRYKFFDFALDDKDLLAFPDDSASATLVHAATNFTSRIREGVSPWQEMHLEAYVITNADNVAVATNDWTMELISDHTWRGFVNTPTNYAGKIAHIRFVGKNMWESNDVKPSVDSKIWYFPKGEITEIPMGGVASVEIDGEEQDIVLDATSGYLMFEFNDESGAFTMNRAEYQDFNKWTPQIGQEENRYIGDYVNTSYVGRAKQEYTLDVGSWPMSRSTSAYWWENFDSMAGNKDYPFNERFMLDRITPNGWTASNGMFINGMFSATTNKTTIGMALQLEKRYGTLSLIDPADIPQGIGTVSFTARLAQYLEFGDFFHYEDGTTLKNYAVSAKATMTNRRQPFCDVSTGTPSLSLVAYYRQSQGCYEFRITRVAGTYNNLWDNAGKMELAIYKWHKVQDPENGMTDWESRKLNSIVVGNDGGKFKNYMVPPTSGTNVIDNATWSSIYFAAYTTNSVEYVNGTLTTIYHTYLEGALAVNQNSTKPYDDIRTAANAMKVVSCTDSDNAFYRGSFGVCTKECPGAFGEIRIHELTGVGPYKNASTGSFATSKFKESTTENTTLVQNSIDNGDWGSVSPNRIIRMEDKPQNDYIENGFYTYAKGLCAAPLSQNLYLKTAKIGDSKNWVDTGLDLTLTSFLTNAVVFSPRTTTPANIQISVGDLNADVVIDDIQLSQWAGDSSQTSDLGSMTKWAFTDGWIAGTTNDVYQGAGSSSEDSVAAITKCGYYVKQLNDTEFIYVFTNTTAGVLGNYAEFVPKQDMTVKELFVLGAGGGGGPGGGGGGGGSAIWVTNDVEYTAGEAGIQIYVGNGGSGGSKTYSNMNPGNSASGGSSYAKIKNPIKPSETQTYYGYGGGAGGAVESGRTNGVNSASSRAGGGGSACKSPVTAKGSVDYASGFGGKASDGAPGGGGGGGLRGVGDSGSNTARSSGRSVICSGTDGFNGDGNAGAGGNGFPVSVLGESEIRYAIAELVAGDKNADVWLGGGGGGGSGESTNASVGKGAGSSGAGGNGGGGQGGQYTAITAGVSSYSSPGFAQGHDAASYTGGGGGGGSFYNPVSSSGNSSKNWIIAGGKGSGGLVVMHVKIKDRFVMLQPMRGEEGNPMSIRTPFLNGISLLSFSWKDAHSNAVLKVQIATNGVDSTNIRSISESLNNGWSDYDKIEFSKVEDARRAQGSTNILIGLRAPISGVVRLLMDPSVVATARKGSTNELDSLYGTVIITGMKVFDEPELDDRSWWGWNIMPTYKLEWSSLYDPVTLGPGRSLGLNFSGVFSKDDVYKGSNPDYDPEFADDPETADYKKHDPFVQTPRFTNRIGAVMFKARVTETNSNDSGWVTISACADPGEEDDAKWDVLTNIEVTASTTVFEPFLWRIPTSQSNYQALRLTTWGAAEGRYHTEPNNVKQGEDHNPPAPQPFGTNGTSNPVPIQRVLIDEVVVTQPMAPKLQFVNAYPFRDGTTDEENKPILNIDSPDQQPVLNETFGMQVQVVPAGMEDELDKGSIRVYMAWYVGEKPWGYKNWKNEASAVKRVELKRAGDKDAQNDPENLVFRSDPNDAAAFIPPQQAGEYGYQIVQYHIWAEYENKNGIKQDPHELSTEWELPYWYFGITDFNKVNDDFSAYTVLDTISPKRAWINEINTFDGDTRDDKCQFIEVAVPQGFDMTGWSLESIKNDMYKADDVKKVAYFGYNGVASHKTANATNSYAFIALQSPNTKAAGRYQSHGLNDGTWSESAFENGVVQVSEPYALRLKRPTGIIEHEVVFMSTNIWLNDSRPYLWEGRNHLENLKAYYPDNDWIYAGADAYGERLNSKNQKFTMSLGVYEGHGESESCWTNMMRQTPGKVNVTADGVLQTISPDYFKPPSGTNLWIYASIDPNSMNSLSMVFGDITNTSAVIIVPQGSDGTFSTSIVYEVKKWFEMDRVVTNEYGKAGAEVSGVSGKRGVWTLDLKNLKMSDPENRKFEVVASTKDSSLISDLPDGKGIAKDDPYYPAVVDWLQNYNEGKIRLAEIWLPNDKKVIGADGNVSRLSLKQMYWLDIPPVSQSDKNTTQDESDWVFKGGMGSGPAPWPEETKVYGIITNIRVAVTMMISNKYENLAHAPNMLRGLEPDSSSTNYNEGVSGSEWNSVTFKITGALQNGKVDKIYRPLRWFTFGPNSFTNGFTRYVDVSDPFSKGSPGYSYEWWRHPGCTIFYRWRIDHDTNRPPDTIYQLNDENALLEPRSN